MITHRSTFRVYYEDTDMGGVVFYANFLKFIERGRSDAVRDAGIDQQRLKDDEGRIFVVRRVVADYLSPGRFGDVLTVETDLQKIGGASMVMAQRVLNEDRVLFTAEVTLVCMSNDGKPLRVPASDRKLLSDFWGLAE